MPKAAPPFRAEHIGSLLRPAALKRAFRQHREGGSMRPAVRLPI